MFVNPGFRDWKHATGKSGSLAEHSRCASHRSATVAWEQSLRGSERAPVLVYELR